LLKTKPPRAALALSLLVLSTLPATAQPVVVKMATIAPEGSQYHLILRELAEKWKSASGGAVELRLYPGSVAGDDVDVVRKMRLGTLNAALLTSAGVATVDKSVRALQIPMLYGSYEEVDYVLGKMAPKLEAALEAKGFVVLNWVDAGWVHFFTKTPVTRPDEMKPMKLFAWAGDPEAIEIWKGAGFNPVPLPSTEISTALQTGLVSALPTTPQAAVILQWYTHAKNMTDVKWALLLGATLVNKVTWEKIPAASRPALLAAAREAGVRLREETRKSGDRDVQAMQKRGLNVVAVDARTEALWRATAESAYDRIRGKSIPPEAFDEAKRHLADFRKQKGAAGLR
jgi:TRAP-type transport system periplasmic protein